MLRRELGNCLSMLSVSILSVIELSVIELSVIERDVSLLTVCYSLSILLSIHVRLLSLLLDNINTALSILGIYSSGNLTIWLSCVCCGLMGDRHLLLPLRHPTQAKSIQWVLC